MADPRVSPCDCPVELAAITGKLAKPFCSPASLQIAPDDRRRGIECFDLFDQARHLA